MISLYQEIILERFYPVFTMIVNMNVAYYVTASLRKQDRVGR